MQHFRMLVGKATVIAILANLILRLKTTGFISISRDDLAKYLLSSTFWVSIANNATFSNDGRKSNKYCHFSKVYPSLKTIGFISISRDDLAKYLLSSTFWVSFANNALFSNDGRKSNNYCHFSKFIPSLTNNRVQFYFSGQSRKYHLASTFWVSIANNAAFSNDGWKSNNYCHFSKFNSSLTNNRLHFHLKRRPCKISLIFDILGFYCK